jgi:hypothetical protein
MTTKSVAGPPCFVARTATEPQYRDRRRIAPKQRVSYIQHCKGAIFQYLTLMDSRISIIFVRIIVLVRRRYIPGLTGHAFCQNDHGGVRRFLVVVGLFELLGNRKWQTPVEAFYARQGWLQGILPYRRGGINQTFPRMQNVLAGNFRMVVAATHDNVVKIRMVVKDAFPVVL